MLFTLSIGGVNTSTGILHWHLASPDLGGHYVFWIVFLIVQSLSDWLLLVEISAEVLSTAGLRAGGPDGGQKFGAGIGYCLAG